MKRRFVVLGFCLIGCSTTGGTLRGGSTATKYAIGTPSQPFDCGSINPGAETVSMVSTSLLPDFRACRLPSSYSGPLPAGMAYDDLFVAPMAADRYEQNTAIDDRRDRVRQTLDVVLEHCLGDVPLNITRSDEPRCARPRRLYLFDSAHVVDGFLRDATGHGVVVGTMAAYVACPPDSTCEVDFRFPLLLAGGSLASGQPRSLGYGTFLDFVLSVSGSIEDMCPGDVANFSVGFTQSDHPGARAVRKLVDELLARGVRVVAAAGNRRGLPEADDGLVFPAAYEGVDPVAALDADGAPLSTRRPGNYDSLSAPGVGVSLSWLPDGFPSPAESQPIALAGSSVSAAVVSGLIARGVGQQTLEDLGACFPQNGNVSLGSGIGEAMAGPTLEVTRFVDRGDAGAFWGGSDPDAARVEAWISGNVRPIGPQMLPQPPEPTCAICSLTVLGASSLSFDVDSALTDPSPSPVQHWLRIIRAGAADQFLDVTSQVQQAIGTSEPVTASYTGTPAPTHGASLITAYEDPAAPGTLYTTEEPVPVFTD